MENGLNFFISFVEAHRFIGYVILLGGMLLEGETILIGAGILVHLKALDPFDTFAIALSGVIMGDLLWYYFGVYLCSRYGNNKFIDYVKKKILRFFPDFEQKPLLPVFISKFIYGMNHSTLVLSGFVRIKFLLFIEASITASTIWTIIILTLGYFLSYTAINISHNIKIFGFTIALVILGFIALEHGVASFVRYKNNRKAIGHSS